jgi:DNA-binding IclR family transcriptional regulator
MPKTPTYPIHSVEKALGLLAMLKDRDRLRVTDVSRELNVAPSTAHRLLSMFERAGFLSQVERNAAYTIGTTLVGLATSIAGQLDIEKMLRPHLNQLAREVNETVHVCILRDDKVVFLDCVESSQPLRAVSRKGQSIPAYATSGGKALLAELSEPEVERIFPREDLEKLTRKTIASRTSLLNELRRTRDRGYAKNAEESQLAFSSFASVVRDRTGYARASIVIAMPASRLRRYESGRLEAAVRAACAHASAALV